MIRKQINFKVDSDTIINYNYNHDVMKNIYYYIEVADDILSRRLHNEGFKAETGHIYKLFNFTLLFENARFDKEGIHCSKETVIKLVISGQSNIVEKVLRGVMQIKKCNISSATLHLNNIKNDKKLDFKKIMLYNSLSGVVESTKDSTNNKVYLSPFQDKFYKNLADNAKRKYKIMYGKDYTSDLFFDIDDALKISEKLVTVKNTNIKCYKFDIFIEADEDMQKIIYYLGLGQNSSSGLGCLNYVKGFDINE